MPVHLFSQIDSSAYNLAVNHIRMQAESLLEVMAVADREVSIVLMNDHEISLYNSQYRKRKGPTNVLSFPAGDIPGAGPQKIILNELGDILISVETAQREAQQEKKSLEQKMTELLIHGLLHLQGYDHEQSEEQALAMWHKEQKIIEAYNQKRRGTMVQLAVNVDHVATIREARGITEPDPVLAAGICELAGASGIVVHLREDRRHIQDRDVRILRETVKTKLNLEMAAAKEMIKIALDIKPDMITLVPEKRQELTTEGGLDVRSNKKKILKAIEKMNNAGIPVSLFIDPDEKQIAASKDVGATFVELHTGRYCDAMNEDVQNREFNLIKDAAARAFDAGLRVNAGHGLDYQTTSRVAGLETIEELSIGHAIISRSVFVGLDRAVREMLALIRSPFPGH